MSDTVTLLHISDLHFVERLTEEGRTLYRKIGVKSHGFDKVEALSQAIFKARYSGTTFDLLIVTGDVSTDGSESSLRTARDFFQLSDVYQGVPQRLVVEGLGFSREQQLVLPGNHDRYGGGVLPLQRKSSALETVFQAGPTYPYSVAWRRWSDPDVTVLFFVFDSSLPSGVSPTGLCDRIARGSILDSECRWLARQPEEIAKNGVRDFRGQRITVDYDECIRIVLLHHHPVIPTSKRNDNRFTSLENRATFVQACFDARANIVLFGHQHEEYTVAEESEGHTVHFICCPSTCEYKAENAGFNVLFCRKHSWQMETYRWDRISSFTSSITSEYLYLPPKKKHTIP